MSEAHFYGALLRMGQALVQAAPFLVVGLFVTGVFRQLLGRQTTRRLFAADSWRSLGQAWVIGMLLPVCSLGVLPIVRELRRCGLAGGTILAFALSAPLFNPLSLLYGLTLSEPWSILIFAVCSLIVVTGAGLIWDRFCPGSALPEEADARGASGGGRILGLLVGCAREMAGPMLWPMFIALLGVGALSLALPPASMQRSVAHDNPWAPLIMAGVATPAYATPMTAMSQIGSMFQHGNSIGAAFTLLTLGAGMNLGLVAWMIRAYGLRRAALWFALLLIVVLGLSWGIEAPLFPRGIEIADHTHAFDIYCRPYEVGTPGLAQRTWSILVEKTALHEAFGLAVLLVMTGLGCWLHAVDPRQRLEAWLARPLDERESLRWYNRRVSPTAMGLSALGGVVAFSAVGCFTYYPHPYQASREIQFVNAEVLGSALVGEREHAEKWLPIYEDWVRKLQVGIYLRGGQLNEFHRLKAELLLERLEWLEHELPHDDLRDRRHLCAAIDRSRLRLMTALEPFGTRQAP